MHRQQSQRETKALVLPMCDEHVRDRRAALLLHLHEASRLFIICLLASWLQQYVATFRFQFDGLISLGVDKLNWWSGRWSCCPIYVFLGNETPYIYIKNKTTMFYFASATVSSAALRGAWGRREQIGDLHVWFVFVCFNYTVWDKTAFT